MKTSDSDDAPKTVRGSRGKRGCNFAPKLNQITFFHPVNRLSVHAWHTVLSLMPSLTFTS